MLLLFNSTRLTEVAADSVRGRHGSENPPAASPWRQAHPPSAASVGALPNCGVRENTPSAAGPIRKHLQSIIEVAVVGEPGPLGDALTEDAAGWSPTFSFASRAEAETALQEQVPALTVLTFELDGLFWAEPVACAEWRLDATVADPLLVADDVLVEAQGRPLSLAGATVVRLRQGRISSVHTYYDEATLIEQVILQA